MARDYRHDRDRWFDRLDERDLSREEKGRHTKEKRLKNAIRSRDISALMEDDDD